VLIGTCNGKYDRLYSLNRFAALRIFQPGIATPGKPIMVQVRGNLAQWSGLATPVRSYFQRYSVIAPT